MSGLIPPHLLLPVLLLIPAFAVLWVGGLVTPFLLAWRFHAADGHARYPGRSPIFVRGDIHEQGYTRRFLWSGEHWTLRDPLFTLAMMLWRALRLLMWVFPIVFLALWLAAVFG